jgi:hypothetical protein
MNLHLHHVLTDLSGQSGLAILDAIVGGERDAKKLASLADCRVKQSQAQIEAALTGDYRAELLFVLNQALQNYRQLQQQIAQCDLAIDQHLASIGDCTRPEQESAPAEQGSPEGYAAKPRKRRKPPNALELTLAGHLKRILGVDLTTIPGLNVLAVFPPGQRDRHQHGQVAPRKSVRLLAGVKSQPQDQWAAGAQLAHP